MDWRRKVECRRSNERCFIVNKRNDRKKDSKERTESGTSPKFFKKRFLSMVIENTGGRVGLTGGDDALVIVLLKCL